MRRRSIAALAGLLPWLSLPPARAQATAPVVLSVSGGAAAAPRDFTLAEFEALGLREVSTTTPWTQGLQKFSGVPLEHLLQAMGAGNAVQVRAEALNRYAVELPASDGTRLGALLATRLDGQPMRVRERGPVWLIYPWTARPELDRLELHERAIWQLRRIELR